MVTDWTSALTTEHDNVVAMVGVALLVTGVTMDSMAERFVRNAASRRIRFIANEPDQRDIAEYRDKIEQIRHDNDVPVQAPPVSPAVRSKNPRWCAFRGASHPGPDVPTLLA
ncbi:hypothetical protein OG520_34925 [Streptomyces sp. NBC_00984]|uniref:hypothetical protein n=1 Tax=Streptomyces sp. NBC_00984 TaxID=2903700 RepID=UPI00386E5FE2|nr:hypothetical protein OG520_34925 [Streptomyces sp. NBC_00984]